MLPFFTIYTYKDIYIFYGASNNHNRYLTNQDVDYILLQEFQTNQNVDCIYQIFDIRRRDLSPVL